MNHPDDILVLNLSKLATWAGHSLNSYQDIAFAAQKILSHQQYKYILIIAPSFRGADFNQTYYSDGAVSFWLSSRNYPTTNYDSAEAILSSAMTACLALGYDTKDAVVIAQMYVNQCMRLSKNSAVDVKLLQADWPEQQVDLPFLVEYPINVLPIEFHDLNTTKIGIYPIVDSVVWLEKLLPLSINTLQLRVKDKQGTALEQEVQQGIEVAKKSGKKLFINDYWQLAIRYNAYGVHLGQEDLDTADITEIHQAGLRLGISSHCYYEVARAHAFRPSYIACGPIFTTTSKIMSCAPQGVSQLKRWRRTLGYPLVAIGGINMERLSEVLATCVNGVAMISAITQAHDPLVATQELLNIADAYVASPE